MEVPHRLQRGFQIDRHLVQGEPLPQIGAIGQAHALLGYQIVFHLHNGDIPALQRQLIGNLRAGETAANDGHPLTNRRAGEVFAGLDHFFVPRHAPQHPGGGAGGDDHLLTVKGGQIRYRLAEADLHT